MKEKLTKKRIYKSYMALCIGAGCLMAVLAVLCLPYFAIWAASGFEADALAVDSCLDRGGRWDYDLRSCHFR